ERRWDVDSDCRVTGGAPSLLLRSLEKQGGDSDLNLESQTSLRLRNRHTGHIRFQKLHSRLRVNSKLLDVCRHNHRVPLREADRTTARRFEGGCSLDRNQNLCRVFLLTAQVKLLPRLQIKLFHAKVER